MKLAGLQSCCCRPFAGSPGRHEEATAAISEKSAKHKGIESPVAGKADILVVPHINGGNFLYKSLVYFSPAKFAGVIVGTSVPIVLTSRSDSDEAKLNSIVLAAYLSEKM